MADEVFSVSLPALPRHLKTIRAFFRDVLADVFGSQTDMVVLALDESCSNVMKHGPTEDDCATVSVRAEVLADRVRFRIRDFCCTEDVPRIKPRSLDDVRPGGLGTHFVQEIMDRVEFQPDPERPGRMALVLEKAVRRESHE